MGEEVPNKEEPSKEEVPNKEALVEGEEEDFFCCRDKTNKLPRSQVCDGKNDCPLNEAGAGGEDEENCDNNEASGNTEEVEPELDWCKPASLNTRSGHDTVNSGPASSVVGAG